MSHNAKALSANHKSGTLLTFASTWATWKFFISQNWRNASLWLDHTWQILSFGVVWCKIFFGSRGKLFDFLQNIVGCGPGEAGSFQYSKLSSEKSTSSFVLPNAPKNPSSLFEHYVIYPASRVNLTMRNQKKTWLFPLASMLRSSFVYVPFLIWMWFYCDVTSLFTTHNNIVSLVQTH